MDLLISMTGEESWGNNSLDYQREAGDLVGLASQTG